MVSQSRYSVCAILTLLLFIAFAYFEFESPYIAPPAHYGGWDKPSSDTTKGLQQVLQFIYNPDRFTLTTPLFAHKGDLYRLPSKLGHTSLLGKKICILDVDTRGFDDKNQLFHNGSEGFEWGQLEPHSGGLINHYMYAQTHGYDYKFYKAESPHNRNPTWVKVAGIADTLKHYEYVVFLDADAIFNQMHVPIEWLLNYWSINSKTSLAMALDPPDDVNEDKRGRRHSNTGFIIAQNNPKTFEILKAWDECPSETRYPGCSEWNKVRFHEQSAYGEHIRYDYDEYLKELPCNEANGEWDLEACRGIFVQHMWWRTPTVRTHFGEMTLQSLMERMHASVMNQKNTIIKTGS